METDEGKQITDPKRLRTFATFFKNYMSVSSLVTASLPAPVTLMGLIPTYSAQTKTLSVYTSLFCFLLLGFIFYSRHWLARRMFPRRALAIQATENKFHVSRFLAAFPLILILASVACVFGYHRALEYSMIEVREYQAGVLQEKLNQLKPLIGSASELAPVYKANLASLEKESQEVFSKPADIVLKETPLDTIKFGALLMILYLGIFLLAEAAFILMAIREYIQDLLGLTEISLIIGQVQTRPTMDAD